MGFPTGGSVGEVTGLFVGVLTGAGVGKFSYVLMHLLSNDL